MSTLEFIGWDASGKIGCNYKLWAWNNGTAHYVARLVRCISKKVYLVRFGVRGMEPCDVIVLKMAHGKEEVEEMEREAGFYNDQLKHLQGTVVPSCFGFYTTKVHGKPVSCLLLEYCSGPPLEGKRGVQEFKWKSMQAAYALHKAGVLHGDLDDWHHFVPMGLDVRIVDFSVSVAHHCVSGLSKRAAGYDHFRHLCACPELGSLEAAILLG
ncbi:hypothetical protein C8R45DRAFT_1080980 [Mycena sanguinolenta]|nr:hypothetical protein C8R45DRAFT_1080980 [Mycena sanguinolenta]